jgi:GTPase Era involved in 16S rRNA processing
MIMDAKQIIESSKNVWDTCEKLKRYTKFDENFENYLKSKKSWIDRLASPEFPVVFLGVFNSGKSTVINGIIRRNLLSESNKECTAIPTVLKRGSRDEAHVYFIDEEAKKELRQLYIEEICKELGISAKDVISMDNGGVLSFLEAAVKEFNRNERAFGNAQTLNRLKELFLKWDRARGQELTPPLEEVQKYVNESYEDIIIVDRVEIFLKDFDVPENVVLVDLPGLAASNPRHKKITREYVSKTAKAFVFCMKPKHLLGVDECDMLAEIKKQNPRVLQRAFWLINQCDTLDEKQLNQETDNFREKCLNYDFEINESKFVRVSALNYLILKCIENGTDDNFIKEHIGTLQKTIGTNIPASGQCSSVIRETKFIRDFEDFREALFEYLKNDCMADFYEDTKKQFKDLVDRVLKIIQPLYIDVEGKNEETIYNEFVAGEIAEKTDEYLKRLCNIFESNIQDVRNKIAVGVFWNDQNRTYLKEKIKESIAKADKEEIFSEITKGVGIIVNYADLPQTIRKVTKMDIVIQENFISLLKKETEGFLNPVLDKLVIDDENKKYLSDDIIEYLKDKIGERDIKMRLQGVLDTFFLEYQGVIDSFYRKVFHSNDSAAEKSKELLRGSNTLDKTGELIKYLRICNAQAAKAAVEMGYIHNPEELEMLFVSPDTKVLAKIAGRVTAEIMNKPSGNKSKIESALEVWEADMLDFAEGIGGKIDKYIQLSMKNHIEDLYSNIINKLNSPATKKEIAKKLSADLSVGSNVNENIRKINDIKSNYSLIRNIKSEIEK